MWRSPTTVTMSSLTVTLIKCAIVILPIPPIKVMCLCVTMFHRMAESLESRKYDNSRSKRGIASASSLSGSGFTGKRLEEGAAAQQGEVRGLSEYDAA